jgi:carboxymethylenebutenolidase
LILLAAADGQATPSRVQIVDIPSGKLNLKGYLWKPAGNGPFPAVLFNHGSGGADAAHTAGLMMAEAAERLGPVFAKHGYAFLYSCRRGQGLSADQGVSLQDVLQREKAAHGEESRQHLQFILMTTDQLDDVLAALSFLKTVPGVDGGRIAIGGHSFGGQLTLLAAEHDLSVSAAFAFAPAAASWGASPEVRERLLVAVRGVNAAIMLIQFANDYDTTPSRALGDELERLHKPHVVRLYPPQGRTSDDGHNAVYQTPPDWENDVFAFLDQYVHGPGQSSRL